MKRKMKETKKEKKQLETEGHHFYQLWQRGCYYFQLVNLCICYFNKTRSWRHQLYQELHKYDFKHFDECLYVFL